LARKTVGYTQLEWICPNCKSKNPGPQKTCISCGSPQPDNVQFQQAETQTLIQNETEIEKAKAGPDIHCGFCGARNPAGTKICSQCGGDLSQGKARQSGQVVGAFQTGEAKKISCPNCGSMNPESALKCSQCGASLGKEVAPAAATATVQPNRIGCIIAIALVVVAAIVIGIIASLAGKTEANLATIQSVSWSRSIAIEEFGDVTREDWQDQIPAGADIGTCSQKLYEVSDDPVAGANEVCSEPYSVDTGSGYAEVVQDCQYEVYKDYCQFTVQDWKVVETNAVEGDSNYAEWPEPQLKSNQRLGDREENYIITFKTDKGVYQYQTNDANLFSQCRPGSKWVLEINKLNSIVSIKPAN
jgi:ribosomal protein L40E